MTKYLYIFNSIWCAIRQQCSNMSIWCRLLETIKACPPCMWWPWRQQSVSERFSFYCKPHI